MRIKADLRALVDNQPVTSFADKVFVGTTTFSVVSTADFSVNDYIIIGDLASESSELRKIIALSGETLTTAGLTFDHAQDTPITKIGYNQVVFYYSSTVTGTLSQLSSNIDITPDTFYTYYDDTANSTGYGWFKFYNSQTGLFSVLSNAVPYGDFDANSVKKMLDRFFTQISNRERKLIKESDVIEWMNEAYAIARNRLNLVNREYTVPTPYTVNIVSGTAEYALPSYFAKVRSFNMNDGTPINSMAIDGILKYANTTIPQNVTLTPRYYIRGSYIGLAPTPQTNDSYFLYYTTISTTLSSYLDYFDLPDNNFYFILDYLMYRAAPIVGGDGPTRLKMFNNGLDGLIITSHKRDGDPASFDRDLTALV